MRYLLPIFILFSLPVFAQSGFDNACANVGYDIPTLHVRDNFNGTVHQTACFQAPAIYPNPVLTFVRNSVNGSPSFDPAISANPFGAFTTGVNPNKRLIGFLSVPTDTSNVNTLAIINFDAFGPQISGSNTAVVVGYDAELNFGTYPATVGSVYGAQLNLPGGVLYNGPQFGLSITGLTSSGTNIGVQFQTTGNQLAGITDLAIQEQAWMKNSMARVQFTDALTCTMVAGTCPATTLPSTTAPGQAYNVVPKCIGVTWTGTGTLTGILKCTCTTTTCTPSSSVGTDTAQVNFIAIGN